MNISEQVINTIAETLKDKYGFATQTALDKAVADLLKRTEERVARRGSFSLSTMIRGMRAMTGQSLNARTSEADVAYCKALTTGTTPGSYLIPTIQAEEIIGYLTIGGIARAAGVRVWPMNGQQKMNVPVATAAPSWVWMAQNSVQTATDPNLGQMAFDLKERRALIAVPNLHNSQSGVPKSFFVRVNNHETTSEFG